MEIEFGHSEKETITKDIEFRPEGYWGCWYSGVAEIESDNFNEYTLIGKSSLKRYHPWWKKPVLFILRKWWQISQ